MPKNQPGFLFWLGIISIIIIFAVYYQGVVSDANAIFPFFIQAGELAQGRNPFTGNFSAYPSGGNIYTGSGVGPGGANPPAGG